MYPDMPAQLSDGNYSDEEAGKNKKNLEPGNKRGNSSGNAYDDLDSIVVSWYDMLLSRIWYDMIWYDIYVIVMSWYDWLTCCYLEYDMIWYDYDMISM